MRGEGEPGNEANYVLPKGYEDMPLVSSMFKITASDELPVPVTVQMEHCAIIEENILSCT